MTISATSAGIRERVEELDWDDLARQLDAKGHAITPTVLSEAECEGLADLFDGGRFRSTIDMARHRFGDGRYRYFDHPLPDTIASLRSSANHASAVAASINRGVYATRPRSSSASTASLEWKSVS